MERGVASAAICSTTREPHRRSVAVARGRPLDGEQTFERDRIAKAGGIDQAAPPLAPAPRSLSASALEEAGVTASSVASTDTPVVMTTASVIRDSIIRRFDRHTGRDDNRVGHS